jgi:hypothetical protein
MDDYIHRPLKYISITDVDILCQVGLRYPMCLCTCVNEEGGYGEGVHSEAVSSVIHT